MQNFEKQKNGLAIWWKGIPLNLAGSEKNGFYGPRTRTTDADDGRPLDDNNCCAVAQSRAKIQQEAQELWRSWTMTT